MKLLRTHQAMALSKKRVRIEGNIKVFQQRNPRFSFSMHHREDKRISTKSVFTLRGKCSFYKRKLYSPLNAHKLKQSNQILALAMKETSKLQRSQDCIWQIKENFYSKIFLLKYYINLFMIHSQLFDVWKTIYFLKADEDFQLLWLKSYDGELVIKTLISMTQILRFPFPKVHLLAAIYKLGKYLCFGHRIN